MRAEAIQRVVLLNGPAGVGKTTLGRRLAASARNGVCMHGDDLKRFVVLWAPLATVAARETHRQHRERLGTRVHECWHELAESLDELGARRFGTQSSGLK